MVKEWRVLLTLVTAGVLAAAVPAGAQTAAARQVTFTKDIAPILQRSCQRCHRPDSVAPMSLITYEQARPYARAMKQRTALARSQYGRGAMPPWFLEKNIGIQRLKDDVSLSDEEIATIAAWADNGAPQGNPADMPPPLKFAGAAEWALGKPDIIVSSPTVFVPAIATDWQGPIGATAIGLSEDRYLASAEFKEVSDFDVSKLPKGGTLGGRFVWHHANVGIGREDDIDASGDGEENERGDGALPIHEVGRNGDVFPPDAGRLVKAHSTLVWSNNHIHSPGVPGAERNAHLDVGLRLHPKGYKPKYEVARAGFGRSEIEVNPNQDNQRIDAYWVAPQHIKLINYEPHMHAAGVRMCIEAIYGRAVETLNCAGYDHNWVRNYQYEDDAAPILPKGTILHAMGWFDNTTKNTNITEARNLATYGNSSVSNMFIVFNQAILLTDEQYEEEVAKREAYIRMTGEELIGCPQCSLSPAATGSR
jgi:hypothetical protein